MMNGATPTHAVRELDWRLNDGIEVGLLWNSQTNSVSVHVDDTRHDDSFEFDVAPAEALDAFRHPYAYANHPEHAHALAA